MFRGKKDVLRHKSDTKLIHTPSKKSCTKTMATTTKAHNIIAHTHTHQHRLIATEPKWLPVMLAMKRRLLFIISDYCAFFQSLCQAIKYEVTFELKDKAITKYFKNLASSIG